jgi:predicted transcriptional regulator
MGVSATSIDNVPVSSVMVREVKTAREDQTVLDVCKVMHDNNIGSVIVIRENASGGKAPEPTEFQLPYSG